MDHGAFDALTRALAAETESRRGALRLLAGGTLGGLLASLDLGDTAAKKHGRRHDDQKRSDKLHTAGKKQKKRQKHKGKDKEKPNKPGPEPSCNPEDRQCYATTTCVGPNECCPGETRCADGECYPESVCCPEQKTCTSGACVAMNECCHPRPVCDDCEEAVCVDGTWDCRSVCHYRESICCQGECLLPCSGGKVINPQTCLCDCPDGQWECPGGACVPVEVCCPGSQRCGPTSCSQPGECCDGQGRCQEGCCPEGYYCHPLGSCCTDGPPFFCTCPSGYHSESGLCVPD